MLLRLARLLGGARARARRWPRAVLQEAPPDYPQPRSTDARRTSASWRVGAMRSPSVEIEREGHYLGVGIANLVTMYAPEVIALSGSVMNAADLFMPTIRAVVPAQLRLGASRQRRLIARGAR